MRKTRAAMMGAAMTKLVDVLRRTELTQGVRLRIALDVVGQIREEGQSLIAARSGTSRLLLANVVIAGDGESGVLGQGDATGLAVLVWEVLACRAAPSESPPPLRYVLDDVSTDVNELVESATSSSEDMPLDAFLDAFESASREYIDTHEAVIRALPSAGSIAPASVNDNKHPIAAKAPGYGANGGSREDTSAPLASRLSITYGDKRIVVAKDRFVIGRRGLTTDLTIQDVRVSREHAAIEAVGERHYIVDLGSAGGIEVGGERIERREIEHGDVVTIGGHKLRFSFD